MTIAVLGATGKTGRYVVARLCGDGQRVVAVGRDAGRLEGLDPRAESRVADLTEPDTLPLALKGAETVISLAHARYTETLLAALPKGCRHLVLTGSTRKFSALPDTAADAVRRAEHAFAASGRPGVMLHPSMIYGAPDDRNVNRLLRLFLRWPRGLPAVVPLPGGGRMHVQPVFVDDVVSAFAAAATNPKTAGPPIVLAGPEPITYAAMVRACAKALGRRARILPLPLWLLAGLSRVGGPFDAAELRRGAEDKVFDVGDMKTRLGVTPRPFEDGLRLKLERGWGPGVSYTKSH